MNEWERQSNDEYSFYNFCCCFCCVSSVWRIYSNLFHIAITRYYIFKRHNKFILFKCMQQTSFKHISRSDNTQSRVEFNSKNNEFLESQDECRKQKKNIILNNKWINFIICFERVFGLRIVNMLIYIDGPCDKNKKNMFLLLLKRIKN